MLSVEDKLYILKLMKFFITKHYRIGKSTVGDIKRNKSMLEVFKKNTEDMGVKKASHKSDEIWRI